MAVVARPVTHSSTLLLSARGLQSQPRKKVTRAARVESAPMRALPEPRGLNTLFSQLLKAKIAAKV